MTAHDYVRTRIVELVVHADDLAESAGVPVPAPDTELADVVIAFLWSTVRHRLGDAELLRALAGRRLPDALRAL